MSPLLSLDRVTRGFGGILAVNDVSLLFNPGQVTILLGPNGAGKTTLFDIITGHLKPDSGRVLLSDRDITGWPPNVLASRGVGRLFQEPRPFRNLSILDNLIAAAPGQLGEGIVAGLIRRGAVRRGQEIYREKARSLLASVGLAHDEGVAAGILSYGQQKLLSLLRLIMAESTVLLLDEPTAGIYGDTILLIARTLSKLTSQGCSIIIVEHELVHFLDIADTVVLMTKGKIVAELPSREALLDTRIREFVAVV